MFKYQCRIKNSIMSKVDESTLVWFNLVSNLGRVIKGKELLCVHARVCLSHVHVGIKKMPWNKVSCVKGF